MKAIYAQFFLISILMISFAENSMGIGELLDNIREQYLNNFIEEINSFDKNLKLYVEPALRDSEGEVVTEGIFETGSRVDVVIESDSIETRNFEFTESLSFAPISFPWEEKLQVTLKPFLWDYATVIFKGEITNWNPLKEWYRKWFQVTNSENSILSHCVHFMSDPKTFENGYLVYLDLGSASVVSVEELFDAAISMNATEVIISNE